MRRPRNCPATARMEPLAETLFYDGHCGLCHRSVQFVVRHDPDGTAFRFAPMQGQTFEAMVPAASREALPDSMVVLTVEGRLLLKSDAWLHIMRGWAACGNCSAKSAACFRACCATGSTTWWRRSGSASSDGGTISVR